jgi:hypothetical protein
MKKWLKIPLTVIALIAIALGWVLYDPEVTIKAME